MRQSLHKPLLLSYICRCTLSLSPVLPRGTLDQLLRSALCFVRGTCSIRVRRLNVHRQTKTAHPTKGPHAPSKLAKKRIVAPKHWREQSVDKEASLPAEMNSPVEEGEGFYILASQQGYEDVLGKMFPNQKHWTVSLPCLNSPK